MGKEAGKPSRRDLLKVSAAVAGATVLQPCTLELVTSPRAGKPAGSPTPSQKPVKARLSAKAVKATAKFDDQLPDWLPRSTTKRPNVVLIVMDTTRVDHLSCYGYRRQTTPNVDAFAAGARRYTNAISTAPWTLPSHSAMFTGLSGSAHGLNWLHQVLDKRFSTLAEQLAAIGYQTVGLSSNPLIRPATALNRGFQTFWNSASFGVGPIAPLMHAQLAGWLKEGYDPGKPFFLFLNYIEPHQPYSPAATHFASDEARTWWKKQDQWGRSFDYTLTGGDSFSAKDLAELEALYDDEVRYMDGQIGQVLRFLKSTGLEESTLVAITADHGEHFGEHHCMDHQFSVYQPLVHVPLMIRHPGRLTTGKEDGLVQNHDLYPTILEWAGLDWKPLPGQNCCSLLRPSPAGRLAISEYTEPFVLALDRVATNYPDIDCSRFNCRLRAIQRGKLKLIQAGGVGCYPAFAVELYDLEEDPMETHNLAHEKPEVADELAAALDVWSGSFQHYAAGPAPPTVRPHPPSPHELKAMRGLGYVH